MKISNILIISAVQFLGIALADFTIQDWECNQLDTNGADATFAWYSVRNHYYLER